ncbi:MAG: transporter related [Firmicutes bacterium]|nr:transporter related [Bacillota bacterium]
MDSALAICTENLTKHYGQTPGCRDVSMAVPAGQVFGFLGPNGAGKSTVVKVLAGLHAPTSGTATIFGHPAGSPAATRLLGFVPELFGLPGWPTAGELLRFYGNLNEMTGRELSARIDEVIERVGLPPSVRTQRIGTFSKGMRQRLCIATALLHRPRLLLLDEPTSALDPVGRREVRDLIILLRQERTTVLLNSHILSDVEMVADQVAIIRKGQIVMSGNPAALVAGNLSVMVQAEPFSPAVERALAVLGRVEPRGGGRALLHLNQPDDLGAVAPAIMASGSHLLELTPQRESLEDLFLGAIGEVKAGA